MLFRVPIAVPYGWGPFEKKPIRKPIRDTHHSGTHKGTTWGHTLAKVRKFLGECPQGVFTRCELI